MWFRLFELDGTTVEAHAADGRWTFAAREVWRTGAHDSIPRSSPVRLADDLAELLPTPVTAVPTNLSVQGLACLVDFLQDTSAVDPSVIDQWRDLLERLQSIRSGFDAAFAALDDLLRVSVDLVAKRDRRLAARSPEDAFQPPSAASDGPDLVAVKERVLRVVSSEVWGEHGTARPARSKRSEANHYASVFRWRRDNVADLSIEDLDALIADARAYVDPLEGGRWALDLDYLLPIGPRLTELREAADLATPIEDFEVVGGAVRGKREVSLVKTARRWGLQAGGTPTTLPAGIGAELAQRAAGCVHLSMLPHEDAADRAFSHDVIALWDTLRHGHDPRVSFTALVLGTREIEARWRRGEWQWRAHQVRWDDDDWTRVGRHTTWRRSAESLIPRDLSIHPLPAYVHPAIAAPLAAAYDRDSRTRGPTPYGHDIWKGLLAEALDGSPVTRDDNPFTPELVFPTDAAYPITLRGRRWASIDEAVEDALRRPRNGVRWARATLRAALRQKHIHDFLPMMVLRTTGDRPLSVPSRWDDVLGPNVVGHMLMEIRAGFP